MALTKITSAIIADGAITASSITDTSITADKLHTTLDLTGKAVTVATASAGDNDTTAASTAFVSTAIASIDTDNVTEGSSNLYFTDARAQAVSINNVVEDTTPQLGGTLDTNNQLIQFGDSSGSTVNRVRFGASSDLQIWHSGTNSHVTEVGTGSLMLQGDSLYLTDAAGSNAYFYGNASTGAAQLRYGNSAKLVTTNTGVTITGAVTATTFSDGTISGITFIDEDSFATNSATRVPTQQSIKTYVDAQVAGVVDSAPAALDTLNELAAALGDDANFSTTTSTALGNRLRVDTASQGLTGTQQANAITNLGITATKAELNYVDGVTSNIQTQLNGKQATGSYLTGNQTITLSGDVSGSGTTSIAVTIADDSHNHIISNVDGLQTALDAKLPLAGGTLTGTLNITQASTADTIKLTRSTTAQNNMIKFASASADKWIVGQRNDSTEHFRFYSYGTSSDVLSIQTDGNVGIGSTSPDELLTLRNADPTLLIQGNQVSGVHYSEIEFKNQPGSVLGTIGLSYYGGAAEFYRNVPTSWSHIWKVNNSEKMRIRSDGGVGIGSSGYAGQPLTVNAGTGDYVLYGESSDALCKASFRDNSSTANIEFGASGNNHIFSKDGTESMRIDSSGNVGIGTTSPGGKLHVEGTTSGVNLLIDDSTGWGVYVSAQNTLNFNYGKNSAVTGYINFAGYQAGYTQFRNLDISNGKQGNIAFFDGVNSRVGIGTISPAVELHVYSADQNALKIQTNTAINQIDISNSTNSPTYITADSYALVLKADDNGWGGTASAVKFNVKGTERMKIAYDGETTITGTKMNVVSSAEAVMGAQATGYSYWRVVADNSPNTYFQAGTGATSSQVKMYFTGMFGSNNTMTVDTPNSRVGIGITSPGKKLDVRGTVRATAAQNDISLSDELPGYGANSYGNLKASANHIYLAIGNSYIGYINSSAQLNASDARLKENVATLTGALDKVNQLRGVSFNWIDSARGEGTHIGFIAQELEEVYPELVGDGDLPNDEDGNEPIKSVDYGHMVPVLVEAIKELKAENDALKARLDAGGL